MTAAAAGYDGALCLGKATRHDDPWFPDSAREHQRRKALCLGCPAKARCLTDALARGEEHGVWGGTTPTERRRIIHASKEGIAA